MADSRWPPEDAAAPRSGHTALSALSPSLLQDLQRFDQDSAPQDLLAVLAAGLRHTQALAIDLAWGSAGLTLSLFPRERLVHCPLRLDGLPDADLAAMRLLQVRPALLQLRPALLQAAQAGAGPDAARFSALGPLLWRVALAGARSTLLPELAGQAAYRIAPGLDRVPPDLAPALAACLTALRRQPANLADIAGWPGMDRARARRLLNALYLQSALIVSRSHPAATNAGWTGYDQPDAGD